MTDINRLSSNMSDNMPGPQERGLRSVFVRNISHKVTEDHLRQIFQKIGPVISLVTDRESGKPKGFGFCEFVDQPTAELAIRNLNGYEIGGRNLRVNSAAAGDSTAEELSLLQQAFAVRQDESPHGPIEGKAPEAGLRAVASLPPEKMFEIMKQLKDACKANPQEVKKMLMDNPQLSYALLQAQIVMRIVDPQVALAMLQRETPVNSTPFHQAHIPGPSAQPPSTIMHHQDMPPPGFTAPPPGYSYPPPAPVQQQPQMVDGDSQQAALLELVLKLSEEEIAILPPGDRETFNDSWYFTCDPICIGCHFPFSSPCPLFGGKSIAKIGSKLGMEILARCSISPRTLIGFSEIETTNISFTTVYN
ncbi:unnamed protein product, partial [Mesorhabditis belari]|uniref:RRM domain-containing protein n=1 Tax=Mesorhabditis belari TaxID=2138241 RepID=A0AAF3E8X6_9BILA